MKYEYHHEETTITASFYSLGQEGWELVTVLLDQYQIYHYFFKRQSK